MGEAAYKERYHTLIIGSGPVGCTFARKLVQAGKNVLMIDAGAQLSGRYGEHLKNSYLYQKNIDLFVNVIKGHLLPASVATNKEPVVTLDPSAFSYDPDLYDGFSMRNQNPEQKKHDNLAATASTYAVGGMATHWTCAVPRFHESVELRHNGKPYPLPVNRLEELYGEAEALLGMKTSVFTNSARHILVREVLKSGGQDVGNVEELPLAVSDRDDGAQSAAVHWNASDTVLGELADPDYNNKRSAEWGTFTLLPEHQCTHLKVSGTDRNRRVDGAVVRALRDVRQEIELHADNYVVACNAVLTPQLLYNSGIRPAALGRYLTEQPMAFCQIVLDQKIVDEAETYLANFPDVRNRVHDYRMEQQKKVANGDRTADPVPIPPLERDPNLWLRVTEDRPWHCQIHRDAFTYGEVPPDIDPRLIVDLRWFGITRPRFENRVVFSDKIKDTFGMPQPTFHFKLDGAEREAADRMNEHMLRTAAALGGFMPGSEPVFLTPGLPQHIAGTTRMGTNAADSVVDRHSRVWGFTNLQLGGNGLHPYGNAANPTLTSVATALHAVESTIQNNTGA
ncbi:pyranose oxidase [Streptomyces marianii]|uniref:Pyranose oxidase n=2 Tax=Streptomyces marianii TaxID=1817406 RepID=A0A5R9EIK0_9ACTN|nr:pyranose oxidase [Streptomyces marianii]